MSETTSIEILSRNAINDIKKNDYIYEVFHENTKLNKFNQNILGKQISAVLSDTNFQEASVSSYKTYKTKDFFPLPKITSHSESNDFHTLLQKRRSVRSFEKKPMTKEQLSSILLYSYGIADSMPPNQNGVVQMLRYSPSGGGLYPLEIYVIALNITDLENGLYHYHVKKHGLEQLNTQDPLKLLPDITSYNDLVENSSAIFLITSVFPRSTYKYGNRGYRFVHLEAGHLGQNILLNAVNNGLGALPVGGFYDDEVNEYLDVDGVTEAVVYEIAIGHVNTSVDFRMTPPNKMREKTDD